MPRKPAKAKGTRAVKVKELLCSVKADGFTGLSLRNWLTVSVWNKGGRILITPIKPKRRAKK